ncbi:MAG: GNAT family N-acetyltransferase [Candidatus Thorarchaeota archaeon]|jgi:ribosomal protein S18 acetylase RimI-like enzyme
MRISIQKWKDIDVSNHITMLEELWLQSRGDKNSIGESLEHLSFPLSSVVVQALEDERLIGWLLLVPSNSKRVLVNPFGVGPLVQKSYEWEEVAAILVSKAIEWTRCNDFTNVEFWLESSDDGLTGELEDTYNAIGLPFEGESVDMLLDLTTCDFAEVVLPNDMGLKSVCDVDKDELYDVYYDAFETENARFFLAQTKVERRQYFEELSQMDLNQDASLALFSADSQVLGFTYVIPQDDVDHQLTCICISPKVTGQGLGTLLLKSTLNELLLQDCTSVGLFTDSEMRAFHLYKKLGWKVTRRYLKFSLNVSLNVRK